MAEWHFWVKGAEMLFTVESRIGLPVIIAVRARQLLSRYRCYNVRRIRASNPRSKKSARADRIYSDLPRKCSSHGSAQQQDPNP